MSGQESAPTQSVIAVSGLTKKFGQETALDAMDVSVSAGQIHALVGLNGAGKTTLMRAIIGMVRPDSGRITILGADVTSAESHLWSQVGHMIEYPIAYPQMSTRDNLVSAARMHGLTRRIAISSAETMLERLELTRWANRRATVLSQGNRQRLGIACALVHQPRVIILDEPTNSLDPIGVVLVRTVLHDAATHGAAILVSSHHLDEVSRIANQITVVHAGQAVGELPPNGSDIERAFFDMVYAFDQNRNQPS